MIRPVGRQHRSAVGMLAVLAAAQTAAVDPSVSAGSIVIICDATAGMADVYAKTTAQVQKAATPGSSFNLVLCGSTVKPLFKDGPHAMDAAALNKLGDLLKTTKPAGVAKHVAAVKAAAAGHPHTIKLLTDGGGTDWPATLEATTKLTADGQTRIDTIYLVDKTPDPKVKATLLRMADVGHGEFKMIDKGDL